MLYIGIDPDCDRSGFALYDSKIKKLLRLQNFDLLSLMDELTILADQDKITVHLEAGWLLGKSNFSDRNIYGSRAANEKIAARVGANHQIGKEIEKFLVKRSIVYKLIKPAGYSSWKHDHFCMITGWPLKDKTNSETRVAGMMVFGY